VQVAYAIGVAKPCGVYVNTFGTGKIDDERLQQYIAQKFDFRPAALIKELNLLRPGYVNTAAYGHFGRPEFSWEKTVRAKEIASDLLPKAGRAAGNGAEGSKGAQRTNGVKGKKGAAAKKPAKKASRSASSAST
jgi:S-adenosylmethionine synthetase